MAPEIWDSPANPATLKAQRLSDPAASIGEYARFSGQSHKGGVIHE